MLPLAIKLLWNHFLDRQIYLCVKQFRQYGSGYLAIIGLTARTYLKTSHKRSVGRRGVWPYHASMRPTPGFQKTSCLPGIPILWNSRCTCTAFPLSQRSMQQRGYENPGDY